MTPSTQILIEALSKILGHVLGAIATALMARRFSATLPSVKERAERVPHKKQKRGGRRS